eukprot:TRINITY_DN26113_c0_g1_i2.p1 TRINITY_DN26113_c0_g1~~TRINITY_DN26113_c0_g1_i2.p1  ORF type:complete len:342 (+),score=109.55 TRINITY_DN26113_c0_g1_i2:803-1828(+)
MESGPRIADLFFLLVGSDAGEALGDWSGFEVRMRQYGRVAAPLTAEEVDALPVQLLASASGKLAWSLAKAESGAEPFTVLCRTYTRASLLALREGEAIKAAAKQACRAASDDSAPPYTRALPLPPAEGRAAAALYCGTYSPVHAGHLETAKLARAALLEAGFDSATVVFSPCHDSYEDKKMGHKSGARLGHHRVAMLREVTAGTDHVVDVWEHDRDPVRLSLGDCHAAFATRARELGYQPVFLCGADLCMWQWMQDKLESGWHYVVVQNRRGSEELVKRAREEARLAGVARSLTIVSQLSDVERSSTRIREAAAAEGTAEGLADAVGIPSVAEYIRVHRLY